MPKVRYDELLETPSVSLSLREATATEPAAVLAWFNFTPALPPEVEEKAGVFMVRDDSGTYLKFVVDDGSEVLPMLRSSEGWTVREQRMADALLHQFTDYHIDAGHSLPGDAEYMLSIERVGPVTLPIPAGSPALAKLDRVLLRSGRIFSRYYDCDAWVAVAGGERVLIAQHDDM